MTLIINFRLAFSLYKKISYALHHACIALQHINKLNAYIA